MEQTKYIAAAENNVKWYRGPEVRVVFVKAQGMLCDSNGNDPMREYDYGNGGFGEV